METTELELGCVTQERQVAAATAARVAVAMSTPVLAAGPAGQLEKRVPCSGAGLAIARTTAIWIRTTLGPTAKTVVTADGPGCHHNCNGDPESPQQGQNRENQA